MSPRRAGFKVRILDSIPRELFKNIFKLSLVLVFLNIISMLFTYYNTEVFSVTVISLLVSLIPCLGSYIILSISKK